ncbi:X-Pro dipeptidyl-peptidase protein [Dendryphion nanum]|uniref:X-Pro dipeptidyl-peptidase protein n=1 Tax=Dendryphion nanum TaxID=256645 RepID=A0A9P9D4Z4_9PLEO|nr:X-Pro dipeptidyl-peptidase protein [Dendryphion nanum]
MQPIQIIKGGIHLAGLLFQPDSDNKTLESGVNSTLPGVVVIHPGGGVKEQAATVYAQRLSEQGFVAVAYDAAHQGDSGGLPRFLKDPNARVSDASAVADYLEKLPYVDSERILVVGICAGGAYAAAAAKGDHRFKAVAMVSAVNIGDGTRLGWYGTEDALGKVALLEEAAERIANESTGAEPGIVHYVPPKPDENTPYDLRDASNYYLTPRAQHPNAQNKMIDRSTPLLVGFDAWIYTELYLTNPVLIIVGELAESKWHSDRIYNKLNGTNPNVRMITMPNGRHMDFYDQDEYVNPAIREITDFFNRI